MAPSNKVCNCTRNITRFTSKSKLSLPFILFLLTIALAQDDSSQSDNPTDFIDSDCDDGNMTAGSSLERNVKVVGNSLVENVKKTGYSISSHGENGDKVYGHAQCRGDLNASACRACVSNTTKSFSYHIPGCIFGGIRLSGCYLRFAAHNFYPTNLQNASRYSMRVCDTTKRRGADGNVGGFKDWSIASLLIRVMENAASSNVGFAAVNESRVYSLAQCWRDLTMTQSKQCLKSLYDILGSCPVGTSQGGTFCDDCVIRYARYKFYGDGVPLLTASTEGGSGSAISPSRAPEGKRHPKMLEWSIGGAVVVLLLVGVVVAVFSKRKVMKFGNSKVLPGVGNLHRPFGRMCGRWQSGHVRPVHSPDSSALMPFAPTSLHSKPAIGWMIIHTADQGIRLGHESVTFWGIYILPDLSVVIMLLHFLRLTPVLQSHGAPLHRSFASGMQIEPPFNLTAVLKEWFLPT